MSFRRGSNVEGVGLSSFAGRVGDQENDGGRACEGDSQEERTPAGGEVLAVQAEPASPLS